MTLHEKYRPSSIDGVIGDYTVLTDRKPHSVFLHGPSGSGKTTVAKAYANFIGSDVQIIYQNVADATSVDSARQIIETTTMYKKPLFGSDYVVILDEVHKASSAFFDALLIPLENPPEHTYYILCTSEPDKVPDTVKSRCKSISTISSITPINIKNRLIAVVDAEQSDIGNDVLREIVDNCGNNIRTALQLLESVIDIKDSEKAINYIRENTAEKGTWEFIDIARTFYDTTKRWSDVATMVKKYKGSNKIESIRLTVLGYGVSMLLNNSSAKLLDCCSVLQQNTFSNGYSDLVINFCKARRYYCG